MVNRSHWPLCEEQIIRVTGSRKTSWKVRDDGDLDQCGSDGDAEKWMDVGYILEVMEDGIISRQTFTFPSAIGRMYFQTPLFLALVT